MVVTGY